MTCLRNLLALLAFALATPALAAAPADSLREKARYDGCLRSTEADPAKSEAFAVEWLAAGGGLPARHCIGVAQLAQGRPAQAASTLSRAARDAEAAKSPFTADLWGQAGNAALAGGDARTALTYLGSAIATIGPNAPKLLAGLHVDRARAAVEAGDAKLARTDLDRAAALDPAEPAAWLLSATLARRGGDLERAAADIARALTLAPRDADALAEAGNIALLLGERDSARRAWEAAVKAAPGSDAAARARQALSGNFQSR